MHPDSAVNAASTPEEDPTSALTRILSKLRHLDLTRGVQDETEKKALGGYADVFIGFVPSEVLHHDRRVMHTRDGRVKVAVKTLRVIFQNKTEFAKTLAREMAAWSDLEHPNILPFLGYKYEGGCPSLISEWMDKGTLKHFLKQNPGCDLLRLALDVANGLEYIHDRDIVHSDMKADNILIGYDGEALICDFGISHMLNSSQSNFVSTTHGSNVKGSTRWMAKEFFESGEAKHSKETDIWAYGMTLYEIITRQLPFPNHKRDEYVMFAVASGQLPDLPTTPVGTSLSDGAYREVSSICTACWAEDPLQRPTMTEITLRLLPLSDQAHTFPNETVQQTVRAGDSSWLLSIDEAKFKASQLRATIVVEKQYLEQVSKNAAPEMMVHVKRKEAEIQQKEVIFHKLVDYIRMTASQQGGPQLQQPAPPNSGDGQGGGGLTSMGFPNTIQQQTGQRHIQSNQNWSSQISNASLPSQFAGNGLPGNQSLLNSASQNGTAQAPQQQLNSPFHPNFVQPQQQQPPVPRTIPTPQQQQQQQVFQAFLQQNNTHSSPHSSGSAPLAGQGSLGHQGPTPEGQDGQHRLNGLSLPLLAREKFQQMLQEWWKSNRISLNPQMLTIGNRGIDIHQLHTEVLQYGGVVNVRRHDLWNVIAAKMGWTPATISETGRTQDQIAEQLKAVYEQLLESFEHTYLAAAIKQSLTAPQQQTTDHQGASDQRRTASNRASRQELNTQQMLQMMRLANIPTDLLRASGYPENLIQNIEQNRAGLQAALHRMTMQRLQANQHQQQQQLQAPGTVLNGLLPFQNHPQAEQNQSLECMPHRSDSSLPSSAAVLQGPSPQNIAPSPAFIPPRPPTVQTQPARLVQQNLRPPSGRTPQLSPTRPPSVVRREKAQAATSPDVTETVPSPSASMPMPSSATPGRLQAYPLTPKSPESKTRVKPRQPRQRKAASVKVQQQQSTTNVETATPSVPSIDDTEQVASMTMSATVPVASTAQVTLSPNETYLMQRQEDDSDLTGSTILLSQVNEETLSKRMKSDQEDAFDAETSMREVGGEDVKSIEAMSRLYDELVGVQARNNNGGLPSKIRVMLAQLIKSTSSTATE